MLFKRIKTIQEFSIKQHIKNLYNDDNNLAYKALQQLEIICTESDALYNYSDEFLSMLGHTKSYVRVRGFRLICSLARWDKYNKINNNIELILHELEDDNATSVRQCLKCLNSILLYKYELSSTIENKIKHLNLTKYKDSMKDLINQDIEDIITNL